jgi:hypothetical protein
MSFFRCGLLNAEPSHSGLTLGHRRRATSSSADQRRNPAVAAGTLAAPPPLNCLSSDATSMPSPTARLGNRQIPPICLPSPQIHHQTRVLFVSPEARSARMAAASGTVVVNRAVFTALGLLMVGTLLYTCITKTRRFAPSCSRGEYYLFFLLIRIRCQLLL